jgi:hypothetical protein
MTTTRTLVSSIARFALVAAALAAAPGCDADATAPAESGEILLSVGTIPDGVACIRVSIVGELRQSTSDFDVTPGASLSQSFSGLPVGTVVFSASAYAQACASVSKATVPMWISEDKVVTVAQGKSTSVTLVLVKNGRAKVTVEFGDQDDAGRPNADGGVGG